MGTKTKRYSDKDRKDFEKSAVKLAPWLLGKILCHRSSDGLTQRFRITVTEAYPNSDPASYAVMYKAGKAVEFLKKQVGTYCIFSGMILVSCGDTNKNGLHDNVLIRGGYSTSSEKEVEDFHDNGNGKPYLLSKALGLRSNFPDADLLAENGEFWIEDDGAPMKQSEPVLRINVSGNEKRRWCIIR